MKKTTVFVILALFIVSIVAGTAIAKPFNKEDKRGMLGHNGAIKEAIGSGDYEVYVAVLENSGKAPMDEEKFNKLVERFSEMPKQRAAMKEKLAERKAMLDTACESGELPEDFEGPMADKLAENFDAFCQVREAKQNGASFEELKELAGELGLENPVGRMGRMHGHFWTK